MSTINAARRIVTGVNAAGKSAVVAVDELDDIVVWEASTADVPTWLTELSGSQPFEPAPGSVKCMSVAIPASHGQAGDAGQESDAVEGLHETRSIDVIFAQDPIVLVLEDGEMEINAGDFVIQCATMHDWRNPRKTPARIVGFSWGVAVPGER